MANRRVTTLTIQIDVDAQPQRCFDLARSMDFHTHSMRKTGERIVGGRSTGLIGPGEEVEFEGRHLGVRQRLRARITAFDPPRMFVDEQVRGAFRSLRHEHQFDELPDRGTRITDRVTFDAGWWLLGIAVERWIIRPHLRRLITSHQRNIKRALETAVGNSPRQSVW